MQNTTTHSVFDVITAFLAAEPDLNALIAYHLPNDLEVRVDELIER